MTTTTQPTSTNARRRLIITEGDGQPVFRTAHRHTATVSVFLNPPDATRAEGHGNPVVLLVVKPDGRWSVATHPTGWASADNPWTLQAEGHMSDDAPAGGAR